MEAGPGPVQSPIASIAITRDPLGRPASIDRRQPLMPTVTLPGTTGFAYDAASQIQGLSWDGLARLTKAALAADSRGVPFVIMQGRLGGSAMAAAAVNALATEIE